MPKVAIIDKSPTRETYKKYFDFEFDVFHLVDTNLKKVLKKDVTLIQDFTDTSLKTWFMTPIDNR